MNWIKYADKKPDVGDTVVAKDDGAYFTGKVRSSNYPIHHMYIDDGGCGYEFSKDSEYVTLEKSTPAKVVKERPRLREGDFLVTNNCLCEECVVLYENKEAGLWLVSFDKGNLCSVIEQEIIKHYRNGELIWSGEE